MPACYTDANNRRWDVRINVAAIERCRESAGVDLLNLNSFKALADDPVKLVKALYAVCDPESQNVTPEQFSDGLRGEALESAGDALVDAMIEFFPPARGKKLRTLVDAAKKATEEAAAEIDRLLTTDRLDRIVRDNLRRELDALRADVDQFQTPAA